MSDDSVSVLSSRGGTLVLVNFAAAIKKERELLQSEKEESEREIERASIFVRSSVCEINKRRRRVGPEAQWPITTSTHIKHSVLLYSEQSHIRERLRTSYR